VNYRLIVRPEVEADLLEAEAWYEKQQAGLGRKFLLAADRRWHACRGTHASTAFDIVERRCAGLTRVNFPTALSFG
jgi:hypothetical protein